MKREDMICALRQAAREGICVDGELLREAADIIEKIGNKKDTAKAAESFSAFWEIWPVKIKKKEAEIAWRRLDPSPELLEKIKQSVALHQRTERWKKGYIPNPATFIRGEQWEDDLSTLGPQEEKRSMPDADKTVDVSFEIMRRALEGDMI